MGGIVKGEYVELVNGDTALIYDVDDKMVTLDCNSAFAGNTIAIEIEVIDIDEGGVAYRPPVKV